MAKRKPSTAEQIAVKALPAPANSNTKWIAPKLRPAPVPAIVMRSRAAPFTPSPPIASIAMAPGAVARTETLYAFVWFFAIGLAAVSAYFSVSGMGRIFPGSPLAITVMAAAMEGGKLVGAALLSHKWRDITFPVNWILAGLVAVLAMLNAAGVFGQLSAAHQDIHVEKLTAADAQSAAVSIRIEAQQHKIDDYDHRIAQIDAITDDATRRGKGIIAADLQKQERESLVTARNAASTDLIKLKSDQANIKGDERRADAELGILQYAADLFGIERDRMMQILIFAMVLTCDPLSIALIIAAASRQR